jgi:hypothetical protein
MMKRTQGAWKKISKLSVEIGPKQTKFGGNCEFSVEDFKRIQNDQKTQYIIGQASYTDIYGDRHITRYCERIYLIKGNLGTADPKIEVANVPCIRHNCSDEECGKEDAEPNLSFDQLFPER